MNGITIRLVRHILSIRQQDLSFAAQISQSKLSRIEAQRDPIDDDALEKIKVGLTKLNPEWMTYLGGVKKALSQGERRYL